ncbi:MAG: phosphate acetyltransferase [Robiginitomaculum sp.]|nr:phosphate acetyltransferase [Robiginitomaculum sp.]
MEKVFSVEDLKTYHALGGHSVTDGHIPEPLFAGLFSYLLGMELPGLGTNYLKQETDYCRTAHVGDVVTASVEITRLRPDKHLADLKTVCTGNGGKIICTGRAIVYVKGVI